MIGLLGRSLISMNLEFNDSDCDRLVKIELVDAEGDIEAVWASPLSETLFRIENCPVFARGVSWHDVVEARLGARGVPTSIRVVERSGARSLLARDPRALTNDEAAPLFELEAMGCLYERAGERLVAIVAPAKINLDEIEALLDFNGWQFERIGE